MYSLSLAVSVAIFVHAQKCARSSTHECTRQKDAMQTCAERVGLTPDTRGANAGYSLCVRRLRSNEHLAHI